MSHADQNIALDVHAHLAPVQADRLAQLSGVQWLPQEKALVIDGGRLGMSDLFDPTRLITWMDENRIARALVSIPPPLYRQSLPAAQAREWVEYVNEEMLRIAQHSNGRLGALYYLPLEHPHLLSALLARYGQGGYEGIALAAGGHPAINYAAAELEPMWQTLDAAGAFVFLHPGTCCDPRLSPFYMENLVGNPYETGVAATQLVMVGVPGRYARIRFCLAHAGGIFATLCGRLEQGFKTRRPGVPDGVERPLQAARRFYVDCIGHHPGVLQLARDVHGPDKVLFGSDWPFPMGLRDAATDPK